ncbi:HNH endonuclease [Candidatus Bipolaricaulota bacterium]
MDKKEVDCIYCGPGNPASKEHIVPQAIGGSYSSSDIICEECNSYFGAEVDPRITNWMPVVKARNIFGLEGYSGNIPSYEVKTGGGQKLIVDRYERLRPKRSAPLIDEKNGAFEFIATAHTEAEVLRMVEQYVARRTAQKGCPPVIFEKNVTAMTHREWSDLTSDAEYGDNEQGRAIAKIAFHFLATQLNRRFLGTRDFDAIRRFVRMGEKGQHASLAQLAPFAREREFAGENLNHVLTLRCSRALRSAVCEVTLFGALDWGVVLSWNYEGPDLHRTLICDLEDGRCSITEIDATPIPAAMLMQVDEAELDNRFERFEESVNTFVHYLNLWGFVRFVAASIRRIMKEMPKALLQHGSVDDCLARLANRFSDGSHPRSLRRFLGLPSKVAAETIHQSLLEMRVASTLSISEIEARFTRLIFLRLLADSIARLAAIRGASAGASHHPSGNVIHRTWD